MTSYRKKQVLLVGAGEFALIAHEYFTYDSDYEVVGFCVNNEYKNAETLNGLPVIDYEKISETAPPGSLDIFVAVPASNLNRLRKKFYLELKQMGYSFASYQSSKAFVWRNAKVGENCFIFEANVVQPFVTIGDNCVLWSGNHIGHRSVIGNHSFLTSHVVVSGYCSVGEGCFLGVNSTLTDNISIGDYSILGAGSVLNRDALPESIYVGSPARVLAGRKSFDAGI